MYKLLEQLDATNPIVDTVTPDQIVNDPEKVEKRYEIYACTYNPRDQVVTIKKRLIDLMKAGKVVNGYLSANYGYGKTATLVYLWHQCYQTHKIIAVPPFKFKDLNGLIQSTYGWVRYIIGRLNPERLVDIEEIYNRYSTKSKVAKAKEISDQYGISESKSIQLVENEKELHINAVNSETVLGFWCEVVKVVREVGFLGVVVFADESQEFLRSQEGSSERIQILSDLIKGMRGLVDTSVALILSMPTDPTESAIEEQSADIIHRMKEQQVYLRLAEVYDAKFPHELWEFLSQNFLDSDFDQNEILHPSVLESLGQLCERKDLSNGPRAVVHIFKRLIHFVHDQKQPYSPLQLSQDFLNGIIELYGNEQHRIREAYKKLMEQPIVQNHSQGEKVARLLAIFPGGVSSQVARDFDLLESLKELAHDGNLYGRFITENSQDRYALLPLLETSNSLTILDEILNRFRQRWFYSWETVRKQAVAKSVFQAEILKLIFPSSVRGQRSNWTWTNKWKEDKNGIFYTILTGGPERYHNEFPYRKLLIAVGFNDSKLMQLQVNEPVHLEWRFYLNYANNCDQQSINSIAGTGQTDFHLQLGRSFATDYPKAFGLLKKVISPEQCSACTLLNLSEFINDWLTQHPDASQADRDQLMQHRRECHQYALQLLFPAISEVDWKVEGLANIEGAEIKLIESIFFEQLKIKFCDYQSFVNHINTVLVKYKSALNSLSLSERRGRSTCRIAQDEAEKLFNVSASGLGGVLSTIKSYRLLDFEEKTSQNAKGKYFVLNFLEHILEQKIKEELDQNGELTNNYAQQEVKSMSYQSLWKKAEMLGYLPEEFDTAIEWLKLRSYIEHDKERGIIYEAVNQLDYEKIKDQLIVVLDNAHRLSNEFDDRTLSEIIFDLEKLQTELCDDAKDELLDRVNRYISEAKAKLTGFENAKLSSLKDEMSNLRSQIESLPKELQGTKVRETIEGSSGLEVFLNDHRKGLMRKVNELERNCTNAINEINLSVTDVYVLHHQIRLIKEKRSQFKKAKDDLHPLIQGLEYWKLIVAKASKVKDSITGDSAKREAYDSFLDETATYFSQYGQNGFSNYERLSIPLKQLEEKVEQEKYQKRHQFDQKLSSYESVLDLILSSDRHLRTHCKFDPDDEKGSYENLQIVVYRKINDWCDNQEKVLDTLQTDLTFLSQKKSKNVEHLLEKLAEIKEQLNYNRRQALESDQNLEFVVKELQSLKDRLIETRSEYRKLENRKEELTDGEQDFLSKLTNGTSISEVIQNCDDASSVWMFLNQLYSKGYIEIKIDIRS